MEILRLEETESTNSYAKEHISAMADKTVVHALRQTCGRGRLNRKWVDLGENNLFFSIVLKPSDVFKSVYSNLTQYASVILCKVFENYGINPKVKWPNDVMVDGKRKICGILCETVVEKGSLKGIILGIGVNLNAKQNDVENIPDRVVTALNLEIGKPVNADAFLNEFLDNFFENYDKFLSEGFEFIMNDYLNRNCFLEKDLKVQVLNEIKSGYAKNINNKGELILQTDNNKELILNIGDIL
ncbi:biotin--[acetyl-CoA-carboxylase] ligase [bacterium]|nr:biotin--[acetyl-CoA-carboxylase] ligase [bacterium]